MDRLNKEQTSKTLVERREFLSSAATVAGASLVGLRLPAEASAAEMSVRTPYFPYVMSPGVEHRTRRWQDQRWLLDAVIQLIGPEWDEGRLNGQLVALCGPDVIGDVNGIRARVKKYNDITREIARVGVRREKMAQ